MSRMKWIYLFLLLAVLIGYQNCGKMQFDNLFSIKGTEIGNPITREPMFGTTASLTIRSYTCALLVRCRPTLTLETCHNDFGATVGIAAALGLPANTYDPYSNLEAAENRGTVVYDSGSLERCSQEIISMDCSDPRIDVAYNSGGTQPSPIQNTSQLYPTTSTNCPTVFREANSGTPDTGGGGSGGSTPQSDPSRANL